MSDRQLSSGRVDRALSRASLRLLLLLATASIVLHGCSQPVQPDAYPVKGVLLVDGAPAANACVAFHPLNRPNASIPVGRTDSRGVFHLATRSDRDGAPAGDYVVTIVWTEDSLALDDCACADPIKHDRLRGFYADADLSSIRVTVAREKNSFRFNARRPAGDESPL
jgi:hypothetical protein